MITCLHCTHCHCSSDIEFDLVPHDQHRVGVPKGQCSINIDLGWCDKPEQDGATFSVLSFGKPSKFDRESWFPALARFCSNFQEILKPESEHRKNNKYLKMG